MQRQAPSPADGESPTIASPFLLLVTGGRDYDNRAHVFDALDAVHRRHSNLTVIHGACCKRGRPLELCGADRWANEWALERQRPCIAVPAPWDRLGDAAGPVRNGLMLGYLPNGVAAFPSDGPGTADMVRQAEAAGVKVWAA